MKIKNLRHIHDFFPSINETNPHIDAFFAETRTTDRTIVEKNRFHRLQLLVGEVPH